MNIIRATIAMEMILLVITLPKRVLKLTTLPLCILPLKREITIQIAASPIKKVECEGRYPFRLPGLVHITAKKDIVRITISVISVIILNLRFSMPFYASIRSLM
jgi:hypothetical protein